MSPVLIIPIAMVHSGMLALRRSQKVGLMVIFALVLIDIVFDIVRTVYALDTYLSLKTNLNGVWTVCEPIIAVMVCAMPHYRSILCPKGRNAATADQAGFSATWPSHSSVVPLEMNDAGFSSLDLTSDHDPHLPRRSWA